jgi:hypothetical protein
MKTSTGHVRRARRQRALASALTLLALTCCSDSGSEKPSEVAESAIALTDANNFESESALDVPSLEVAADADLDICWDAVNQDIQCHDVVPAENLNNVTLLRFLNLSEEQVEERLTSGQLSQSEVDGFLEYNTTPDSSCTTLSEFSFFGTPVEIEEEFTESDEHIYMLLVTEGTTPGVGARTMMFLRPTANSSTTEVQVETGCGMLSFEATLSSLEKVSMPAAGPWNIDWRQITRDGGGAEVPFQSIDRVLIGFYEGMGITDLEEDILDIELIAANLWEVELDGGKTADLSDAKERDTGESFEGFEKDVEGTWLLGLMCSTCQNPAPILLTVIDPE